MSLKSFLHLGPTNEELMEELKQAHAGLSQIQVEFVNANTRLLVQLLERKFGIVSERLDEIDAKLDQIGRKEDKIMLDLAQRFDALRAALDADTTRLADQIAALKGQIAGSGMTAEQEESALASLNAIEARLRVLGSNPEDPVPAVETAPAESTTEASTTTGSAGSES